MSEFNPPNPTAERELAKQSVHKALQKLEKGTQHPDYPPALTQHFHTLASSIRVLDDKKFDRRTYALTKRSTHPKLFRHQQHVLSDTLAVKDAFTFQPPLTHNTRVIIRSSYAAKSIPPTMEWILAEEFGHLSTSKKKGCRFRICLKTL